MHERRLPVVAAVAGLLVAMVASLTFASSPPSSPRGAEAADGLLAAWDLKLHGTYVVDSTFTRTLPDGAVLRDGSRLVQRPPDRLLVGLGAAEGRVGGRLIRCGPVVGQTCSPTAAAAPYEEDVAAELATLRSYVTGDAALYRVVEFEDARCFRLELARGAPSPPYGHQALFCFDGATGAPSLTVVERKEAVDRTEAVTIRAQVTDDDLRVPADRGTPLLAEPDTSSSSG
jgi:hypothetical protein